MAKVMTVKEYTRQWAIPLAALILAAAGFGVTLINTKRSADRDYVQSLDGRLSRAEEDVRRCRDMLEVARSENASLMHRLFNLDGGGAMDSPSIENK